MSFKMPYEIPTSYAQTKTLLFENDLVVVHHEGHQTFSKTKANPDLSFFWMKESYAWILKDPETGAYGPCYWATFNRKDIALERIYQLRLALTQKGKRLSKDIRSQLPALLDKASLYLDGKFMTDNDKAFQQKEVDNLAQKIDSLCSYYTISGKRVFPDNWMDISTLAECIAFRNAGFSAD